ncbi:MAG: ABC transporter permease [Treponema sp.]|jgi:spermidine/putrescine transport system permease protein|nr:ABC transporter permease [Treponema sp.]
MRKPIRGPLRQGAGKKQGRPRGEAALVPMYLFTLAFVVGPFLYMIALSFMRRHGAWGVEAVFSLRNYLRIPEPVYLETFRQSIKLALYSTVATVILGYPFGYFMARFSPKWRNRVMILLIIPFWTSALMRLYGWIIVFRANGLLDSILMQLRLTTEPLRFLYNYPSVVTGMIYALLPFMIYSVFASAEKLDWGLVEAARVMGASRVRAFLNVSLPLTLPGLFSGVILTFIPSMGLYYIADILGGNKVILVGSLIHEQLMNVHDWPFAAALSVVLMILTSLFLYLYRRLTRSGELEGLT